ncbi:MAG: class I SAM-dependent RNA methyltransferase [Tenericutes bacterium]|nr:class I SAM-dependent RNA methyltransferase [Mycoplasmatota bacterium]
MTTNIKIEKISYDGKGIGYIDGKVAFVSNALPNEIVNAKIIKENKNYYECETQEIIEKSKNRIKPACPYFNECGGCSYMHVTHEDEVEYKVNALKEILKRNAVIDANVSTIISNNELGYRNKLSLKVENYEFGFYKEESHEFIKIDECLLASLAIRNIFKLKEYLKFKEGNILIRSNFNDEIIIKINSESSVDLNIEKIKEHIKLVGIIINEKVIYGEDFFIEQVHNYFYKVNINSFFQINLNILDKVINLLREKEYNTVADLYCGVGTLGIPLKKQKLYGIEIVKEAVIDAIYNAKINKQDNKYLLGSAEAINKINAKIDTIIIDPPRAGLNKKTLDFLINYQSDNLIYMSCNPMTLAKNLKSLSTVYNIEEVFYLDMFPRTKHIECVSVLSRKAQ